MGRGYVLSQHKLILTPDTYSKGLFDSFTALEGTQCLVTT